MVPTEKLAVLHPHHTAGVSGEPRCPWNCYTLKLVCFYVGGPRGKKVVLDVHSRQQRRCRFRNSARNLTHITTENTESRVSTPEIDKLYNTALGRARATLSPMEGEVNATAARHRDKRNSVRTGVDTTDIKQGVAVFLSLITFRVTTSGACVQMTCGDFAQRRKGVVCNQDWLEASLW